MKRIVVSGYYGAKNAGDEAMLAAMLEVLDNLKPKLHITVISADPEDTERRHGVHSIGWLDIPKIITHIKRADLLISGGGSLLQNVTSRRSLYYYMAIIKLAQILNTPTMLYAQGIGPINGSLAHSLMKNIGNKVQLITVRDEGSLAELRRLGITTPIMECTADPVLGIKPVDEEAGRVILKRYNALKGEPIVGISVRDWQGWQHYKEVLARAADKMVSEYKARVVFLPMQYPEDIRAAESIYNYMQEEATILSEEYTTSELLSLVSNMDIMIGIRLHALIFAGVMGVPMIGISYDPKIDRFLRSIGETPVNDLQDITLESLLSEVRAKWASKTSFQKSRKDLLQKLRTLATRNAELAIELMDKGK